MTTMQGWAVHLSDVADHTYVGNGNGQQKPSEYYACWGQNYVPGNTLICTGNGNTNVANCYRDPFMGFPDTAGIGVYAVNGVCHQSANCFLFSSNVGLTLAVRGYWLTVVLYGPYGTLFPEWFLGTYGWCSFWNGAVLAEAEAAREPTVGDKVRALYAGYMTQDPPPNRHEALMAEAAIVGQHYVPELDPASYQALHAQLLKDKDAVVAKGQTGQVLADELNSLSKELQTQLAKRLGTKMYKELTGYDAGTTVNVVEHGNAAGHRPPAKDLPDQM